MADSTQLMALGKMLSGFGDLGMKGAFTFSQIEEDKANAAWQDFVHKKAVIDFKLEQFTRQQEKVIKDRTMEMVTDGMQNMQYGGDPVKAMNAYNTLMHGLKNNPSFAKIIYSDAHAADVVTDFLKAGSGTLVDTSKIKFPDGKGAPNFEIIRSGETPFDRFQQLQIVAGRIPQYVDVTLADGTKKTIDQRAALYESQGFSLPMIHYDTVNGTATATAQEFIDNARAQKFAQDNPGVSYGDAKTILSLGVGSVQVGDKFLSPVDAFSAMRGGDAAVTTAYLRQSPDMKATASGLAAAGIPITDNLFNSAVSGKIESVAMGGNDQQVMAAAYLGKNTFDKVKPSYDALVIGIEPTGKNVDQKKRQRLDDFTSQLPGMDAVSPEVLAIAVNGKTPQERQQALNTAIKTAGQATISTAASYRGSALRAMDTVMQVSGTKLRSEFLSELRGDLGSQRQADALSALKTTTVIGPDGQPHSALNVLTETASKLGDSDLQRGLSIYGPAGATEKYSSSVIVDYVKTLNSIFNSSSTLFSDKLDSQRDTLLGQEASKTSDMMTARGVFME